MKGGGANVSNKKGEMKRERVKWEGEGERMQYSLFSELNLHICNDL